MLNHISDFIKKKLDKKELKEQYNYPRNQLYQMYYVMAKLNAHGFCKLDFAVNFGIPIDVKSRYCELVNSQRVSRANCY